MHRPRVRECGDAFVNKLQSEIEADQVEREMTAVSRKNVCG